MEEAATAASACTLCAPHLPLGPRPIHQLHARARILITSQAPGTKAHLSGIPFEDASGERLRDWLGLGRDIFYDPTKVAILPMGLCYPGRLPRGGDCPPRPECAPLWHPRVLPRFTGLRLRLLVGSYAVRFVLGTKVTLSQRVARYAETLPAHFPLPHPSWRTLVWAKRNPWFDAEVIPALRQEVERALAD
ncbi:uracil-DNA glycosylase family protein [Roseomonas sp. KE2513]|uniref:uracil-DNA glycosylase family protein n=1 Tax=Roseomonas sp. KE2513 TaxID=2479202 RepID=UPI0018DF9098|nr:uracil-DNA glycosylase family protein [Roseomonas sp. KE2513]MBI0536773.1 uracil-DNA glycosylase family protein [Roseomonas sp. KE2513]